MKISGWGRGEILSVSSWEKSVLAEFSGWAAMGCPLGHSCNTTWCPLSPEGGRTRVTGVGVQRCFWRGSPGYLAIFQGLRERHGGKGEEKEWGCGTCGMQRAEHTLWFSLYPKGAEGLSHILGSFSRWKINAKPVLEKGTWKAVLVFRQLLQLSLTSTNAFLISLLWCLSFFQWRNW